MGHREKLLFLSALYPLPVASGTQARVLHLLQRLSRRFDVTLLSLVQGPGEAPGLDELQRICARVVLVVPDNKRSPLHRAMYKALYWFRRLTQGECADRFYTMVPRMSRAIRHELRENRFDVLFFSYWFWSPWVYDTPGYKVVDTNDVQWERHAVELQKRSGGLESLFRSRLLRRYQSMEIAALHAADLVVSTTERDREVFAAHTNRDTEHLVVPTGIDTEHFAPAAGAPDRQEIVFYGALGNPMNRDAVVYLVQAVLPRIRARLPGARLTIVGAAPPPEIRELVAGDDGIRLTGYVEDVREPLRKAGVVLLPLRFGHGIRGRVFELFALGLPVVATPVAVAGMGLESGDGLLLAESPEDFAAATVRVLQEPHLRDELVRRGRVLAESRFSIEATYDRLADFLGTRTASKGHGGDGVSSQERTSRTTRRT